MSTTEKERDPRYQHVRDAFDELKIEDKAVFLLEAGVTTLVRGIEQFTRFVASEVDKAFSQPPAADEPIHPEGDGGRPAPNVTPGGMPGQGPGGAGPGAEGVPGEDTDDPAI